MTGLALCASDAGADRLRVTNTKVSEISHMARSVPWVIGIGRAVMLMRFNGVRPINLAAQIVDASPRAKLSSTNADNRLIIAGGDFGCALTGHIFRVDVPPSAVKTGLTENPAVALTKQMQPELKPTIDITPDLKDDGQPPTRLEPIQSVPARSDADTPDYPLSETGKGAGPKASDSAQKFKGVLPHHHGQNSVSILSPAWILVPVGEAAAMTSAIGGSDPSASPASSAVSSNEGAPSATSSVLQFTNVGGALAEDKSGDNNDDFKLTGLVDSSGAGADHAAARSSLSTDPLGDLHISQFRDGTTSLSGTHPPATQGDLGKTAVGQTPNSVESLPGKEDNHLAQSVSKMSDKIEVQSASPLNKTHPFGNAVSRAVGADPIRQLGSPSPQGQVSNAPLGVHSPGVEGPTAGMLVPHVGPAAAVTAGNPYQRLDQISSSSVPILSAGANRMTVGLHDPALGWVEIKTQATAGQVTAALLTASSQTHHDLTTQLPVLAQFLSQREVKVSSLAVEHQSPQGSGNNRGGSRDEQEGNRSKADDEAQSGLSAVAGVGSGGTISDSYSNRYISVLA